MESSAFGNGWWFGSTGAEVTTKRRCGTIVDMTPRPSPQNTSLASPAGWEPLPLDGWFATVTAAIAAVVMAVPAVVLTVTGQAWGAAMTGAAAIVLLAIAVLARPKARREPPLPATVEVDGVPADAVRFPVRPNSPVVSVVLAVVGIAFVALAVAAAVIAVTRGEWPMLAGFLLLAAIGAVFLLGGVAGLRAARSGLGIWLTPRHVVLSLGFDRQTLSWDEIEAIKAMSMRYGFRTLVLAPVQHWLLVSGKRPAARSMPGRLAARISGDVVAGVPTMRLAGDPVLLYHTMRRYLSRPAERGELGDGTAIRRMRSGTIADAD